MCSCPPHPRARHPRRRRPRSARVTAAHQPDSTPPKPSYHGQFGPPSGPSVRRAGGGQASGQPGEQDRAVGNGGHLPAPHSLALAPQGPQAHQPPRSAPATVTLCRKCTHTTPFLCKNTQTETRARGEQRMDTVADVRGRCRPDPTDTGVNRDPETPEHRRAGTETQGHTAAPQCQEPPPHSHTPPTHNPTASWP